MTTHRGPSRNEVWPSPAGRAAAWVGVVAGGLLFVGLGASKLFLPGVVDEFHRLGLSDGLRVLVGVAEVAGGLLLLRSRTWPVGVAALGAVFAVAVGDQALAGRDVPLVPLALLASVAVVAWVRDEIAWWDRYAATLDRYAAGETSDGR